MSDGDLLQLVRLSPRYREAGNVTVTENNAWLFAMTDGNPRDLLISILI